MKISVTVENALGNTLILVFAKIVFLLIPKIFPLFIEPRRIVCRDTIFKRRSRQYETKARSKYSKKREQKRKKKKHFENFKQDFNNTINLFHEIRIVCSSRIISRINDSIVIGNRLQGNRMEIKCLPTLEIRFCFAINWLLSVPSKSSMINSF